MKTIWKFRLIPTVQQEIPIPAGARLLHVEGISLPGGGAFLWALVDTDMATVQRTILTLGTGHDIPDVFIDDYIGTVVGAEGLVLHFFDLGEALKP